MGRILINYQKTCGETKQIQSLSFEVRVKKFELAVLKEALAECQYHQKNTAKMLGLTYHQLRALLRKYKKDL